MLNNINRTYWLYFSLFAVSGFAGLIYESIWSHYLKTFLGHASYAQTLVLIIFMGGMSIGAFASNRHLNKTDNAIKSYAFIEALIGLYGLLFHFIYQFSTEWLFTLIATSELNQQSIHFLKWSLGALLILPPAILLGATFPILSGGILRKFPNLKQIGIAYLYFTNSLGASLGILFNSFVLIPSFGLQGAITTAALINLFLALIFFKLSKQDRYHHKNTSTKKNNHNLNSKYLGLFLLTAGFTGMASFMYEIAWIRMLSMVLASTTHAFDIMLSAFILGLAIGGFIVRFMMKDSRQIIRSLIIAQSLMALFALLTITCYNQTFELMLWFQQQLPKTEQGFWLFNLASYSISMIVMLPTTICAGMTLPLITTWLLQKTGDESYIGKVYGVNTIGAILGIVISVHFLMPTLGLKYLIIAGGAVDLMLALLLLYTFNTRENFSRRLVLFSSLCAFAIVTLSLTSQLNYLKMASGHFRTDRLITNQKKTQLLFVKDGKTSTVHVRNTYGYYGISNNGKTDAAVLVETEKAKEPSTDESTMMLLGSLGYLYNDHIENVANIGFGSGLTAHTILHNNKVKRLDNIEIEAAVVEAAKLFGHRVENAYNDSRSHFIIDDAKTYFASNKIKYDLIVSEPPNPWVSGVANLFTQEFYQSMTEKLNKDGLFVQWIHTYNISPEILASIYKTLNNEFPHLELYQIGDLDIALVASHSKLITNPSNIFKIPSLKQALNSVDIHTTRDITARKISAQPVIAAYYASFDAPINTDMKPYIDHQASKDRFLRSEGNNVFRLFNSRSIYKALNLKEEITFPSTQSMNFSPSLAALEARLFIRSLQKLNQGGPLINSNRNAKNASFLINYMKNCQHRSRKDLQAVYLLMAYHPYISDKDSKFINDLLKPCINEQQSLVGLWTSMNEYYLDDNMAALHDLTLRAIEEKFDISKPFNQILISYYLTSSIRLNKSISSEAALAAIESIATTKDLIQLQTLSNIARQKKLTQ